MNQPIGLFRPLHEASPDALQGPAIQPAGPSEASSVVLPSLSGVSTFRSHAELTSVVCDSRAIVRLLEKLLDTGGLTTNEAARGLGLSANSIRQYTKGRRSKPSLQWFVRLAELCGARVMIEFKR